MHQQRFLLISLLGLTLMTVLPLGRGRTQVETETSSGRIDRPAVRTQTHMTVAAHPLAAKAGSDILKQGGNAIDAVIAVQMVLGLVEPNASGIGGGGFLVSYDAKRKQIGTFDGRETAPANARPDRFLDAAGQPLTFYDAVVGGKSVGVPGVLRMLELAHRQQGKLPWRHLFQPAIQLAERGIPISPRLQVLLTNERHLFRQEPARSYFYQSNGQPKPTGSILVNRPYAQVLRRIADTGADAFYRGAIANDLVATVQKAATPGDLTLNDLATYRAIARPPVCGVYRVYKVCSMGPPSSGGLTVLQLLGMLEQFPLAALQPGSTESVHLFAEAGRLAYADRGVYMADADFVPVPMQDLLDPDYLRRRAQLINPQRAMTVAAPGKLPTQQSWLWGEDQALEFPSTSHVSIVDGDGNAVALTSSLEDNFGSRLMVHGVLLNNQLTDFSFTPTTPEGKPIANRVEPQKRPRSSMAPTLVFDRNGKLVLVVGSAGGSRIINYVAKALVGVLDWKLDSQQAVSLPNFGNRNGDTELEAGTRLADLQPRLKARGHSVAVVSQTSGSQAILVTPSGLIGGSDPRRGGVAIGE